MKQTRRLPRWDNTLSRAIPVRGLAGETVSVAYDGDGLLTRTVLVGACPQATPRCIPRATVCWVILGTAEGGAADASNHTQFEFRVGTNAASYTVLATVTTATNPAAGLPLIAGVSHVPNPGEMLSVNVTAVGSGTTNFTNANVVFGVEFRQERFS